MVVVKKSFFLEKFNSVIAIGGVELLIQEPELAGHHILRNRAGLALLLDVAFFVFSH